MSTVNSPEIQLRFVEIWNFSHDQTWRVMFPFWMLMSNAFKAGALKTELLFD